MKNVLLSVKGIGEKKAQDIMEAINAALQARKKAGRRIDRWIKRRYT